MFAFPLRRLLELSWIPVVILIGGWITFGVLLPVAAQDRHWSDPVDGNWDNAFNWTGSDVPDTILETANINTAGTYEVIYNGNYSISGLTLGATGASLTMFGVGGQHASLELSSDLFVFGTINLDSNQDGIDTALICNGTITNESTGNINFGGTSLNSASDRNLRADLFINNGNVNVNQNGRFDQTNGVFTNNNVVNVANGKTFTFGINNTLNQNAGTFFNQGNVSMTGGTVNLNGGNFLGNALNLRDSTLNLMGTGSGEFNLTGNTTFSGNVVNGQQLNLNTAPGVNQETTVMADFNNFGVINLNSNFDGIDVTMTRAGLIGNSLGGTINFGGTSLNNATDRRLQADNFVNDGVVNINRFANFDQTDGVYTNNHEINIATSSRLLFGTNNTFNQNGGTFDNQGSLTFDADTLNFNGGNFTGNAVSIHNSILNNNTTGTGVFNLTGTVDYMGDLVSGQFLNLATAGSVGQTTNLGADFTNFSTINIDSNGDGIDVAMIRNGSITNASAGTINFGGSSLNNATDRRLQADVFVNDGVVNINRFANFDRTDGVYTNNHAINIATGSRLLFGTNNTFNQNGGTFDNQGSLAFDADTLNFNGGNFTGNAVSIHNSILNNNTTGTGVFNLTGTVDYMGDLVSGQFLNLATAGSVGQTTNLGADFTNFSTINIDSNGDGIDVTMIRNGSITNASAGTINFGGTSLNNATDRRLQADNFLNDGVVNINRFANFDQTDGVYTNNHEINIATSSRLLFGTNNTFNQNGGTFDNQGSLIFNADTLNFNGGNFTGNVINLFESTLNIGPGSFGTANFVLTGNNTFNGDLSANQTMNLFVGSNVAATTTAVADFVNSGLITLTGNSDGIDVRFVRDGLISNSAVGRIEFAGSSINAATDRIVDAELHNAGWIEIGGPSLRAQIGSNSGTQVMTHSNSGTILNLGSTLSVLGESFVNEDGGILAGEGIFDFVDTGMTNEGIIAPGFSAGHLELRGLIELAPTSDLQFELGGTLLSEFDRISFTDALNLGGGLSVSFINSFQDMVLTTDAFTIVDSFSTSGTFFGLADGDRFSTSDGYGSFQINYSGNDIVLNNFLTSVPEPSSFLLLGFVFAMISNRRRRVAASSW